MIEFTYTRVCWKNQQSGREKSQCQTRGGGGGVKDFSLKRSQGHLSSSGEREADFEKAKSMNSFSIEDENHRSSGNRRGGGRQT